METALITGCSSGIGRVSATHFAQQGYRVFATVRDTGAAASLSSWAAENKLALQPIHMDVTSPDRIARAMDEVLAGAGSIDVLINNAGIAIPGAFEDMPWAALEKVMGANFYGPLHVTRAVLPHMRQRGSGKIIMVSSLSARVGLPGMSAYSASKAALELASESLRLEVDRFGISVSVIEPGAYNTAMPGKIIADMTMPPDSPYRELLRHLHAGSVAGLGQGDDPMRVADLLLEVARTRRPAFRYPAGAQAQQVINTVAQLDPMARDEFIRSVDGTEWWSEGKAMPSIGNGKA
jgi:NAD(P)-dependent dehydrogenase (short-subunit alcohol dehydrogenase family)